MDGRSGRFSNGTYRRNVGCRRWFLVVPALTLVGGLSIQQAVGTSLLVIAMQSFAGSMGYLGHAAVNFRLVSMLALAMGKQCGRRHSVAEGSGVDAAQAVCRVCYWRWQR